MAQAPKSNSDLMATVAHLDRDSFKGDEGGRLKALEQARALCRRLERPWDALVREMWQAPSVSVAIKVGQDLGLFTALSLRPGVAQTIAELAEATKSDPRFLGRIVRALAAVQFLDETNPGSFRETEISRAFTEPGFVGGMQHKFTQMLPVFQNMPRYLSKTQYTVPEDPMEGPFQFGMGGSESFFEWLESHPVEGRGFHELMALYHQQAAASWVNIFPVTRLVEGVTVDPDSPLVIDIGGGIGADMENLRQALLPQCYPLMVQDLDHVLDQGRLHGLDASITFHAHDFFQEQPVKGARAYFIHSCLHDWPDPLARQILNSVRTAMRPGYSKLLICESVMPERAAGNPRWSTLDLVMMGLLCSKERTEAEWAELLDSAGLKVVQIWGQRDVGQCVIEAELAL